MALTPKQARFVAEYAIDVERFWSKVDKSGECWLWTGARDASGYGRFHVGLNRNSAMLAHRVSYGMVTGERPEAVCHHCDTPSCVRPDHLFGGTRSDNNRDMVEKGRHFTGVHLRGQRAANAKLTDSQANDIRLLYGTGVSQRQVARAYGVSQRTVAKIVTGVGYAAHT